jgi:hypothetical protein
MKEVKITDPGSDSARYRTAIHAGRAWKGDALLKLSTRNVDKRRDKPRVNENKLDNSSACRLRLKSVHAAPAGQRRGLKANVR